MKNQKYTIVKSYRDYFRVGIGIGNADYILRYDRNYLPAIVKFKEDNYVPIYHTDSYVVPLKVSKSPMFKRAFIKRCEEIIKNDPIQSIELYRNTLVNNQIELTGVGIGIPSGVIEITRGLSNTSNSILEDYNRLCQDSNK